MAQTRRSRATFTLTLLAALGIALLGCEKTEDPMVAVDPEPGSFTIEAGAEGGSAWLLVAPDGTEAHGQGDTLITEPQAGDYWLLWEPVEAWHSPADNPVAISYADGATEVIQASYAKIQGEMGTVRIDVTTPGVNPTWNLFGPNGFFCARRGHATFNRRATGEYVVVWEAVEGFVTPPQVRGHLAGNSTLTLDADYQPVSAGAGDIEIVVRPTGLAAAWHLEHQDGSDWIDYGSATLEAMPLGDYTLRWGAVEGYEAPPAPVSATLGNGERLVLEGDFVRLPDPVGTVEIDVTPDLTGAEWRIVSDQGGSYGGVGDRVLENVPVGTWTLSWFDIPGYRTPEPAEASLTAGDTLRWSSTYVADADPVGTIAINPDPDALDAPWQLSTATGLAGSGNGDKLLEGLPVGSYEVVWGDVEGYLTPAPSTATLTVGKTVELAATYAPAPDPLGTIHIDPDPNELNAPWELRAPNGDLFAGAGDSTLTDLPLGDYTLMWGSVEGWEAPTPNPVTQTLGTSGVARFSLR